MITMTQAQADQVRGGTSPGAALNPVQLANLVEWVLPVAVISDPAHAMYHDVLSLYPQRDVAANEFKQDEGPI